MSPTRSAMFCLSTRGSVTSMRWNATSSYAMIRDYLVPTSCLRAAGLGMPITTTAESGTTSSAGQISDTLSAS